tara:strand:+ start:2430 stop:2591 length:162 start_codon:yes stop_codon:yes gene_type:complete
MYWILEKCFKWKYKYLKQKNTNKELIKCINALKKAQDELLKYVELLDSQNKIY